MGNSVFLTGVQKASVTVIGRDLLPGIRADIDQLVALISDQQFRCHYAAGVIVCIDAADGTVFPLNGDNRDVIRSQFFRRDHMTEYNESFDLIAQKFFDVFPLRNRIGSPGKNKELIVKIIIGVQKLVQ